jgi:hypothetical protein
MKRRPLCGTAASLLCVGLLGAGGTVTAQDARDARNQQQQQEESKQQAVMKECVKRERAGDNTMSEAEARKACHDALRAERENHDNEPQPHPHQ